MSQYCVTALKKDQAILCGLRLVLGHLGSSEPINLGLTEHQDLLLKHPCFKGSWKESPCSKRACAKLSAESPVFCCYTFGPAPIPTDLAGPLLWVPG